MDGNMKRIAQWIDEKSIAEKQQIAPVQQAVQTDRYGSRSLNVME